MGRLNLDERAENRPCPDCGLPGQDEKPHSCHGDHCPPSCVHRCNDDDKTDE